MKKGHALSKLSPSARSNATVNPYLTLRLGTVKGWAKAVRCAKRSKLRSVL
jgi:hypothetical protein